MTAAEAREVYYAPKVEELTRKLKSHLEMQWPAVSYLPATEVEKEYLTHHFTSKGYNVTLSDNSILISVTV